MMRALRLSTGSGKGRATLAEFNPCRALCQRVAHVLIALGEKLLLFVSAGQRVAAVVRAHVEGGIHWVGEVSGLQREGKLYHDSGYENRCIYWIWVA